MKTITFLILLSILPFILNGQWYPQNSGTSENLSSIYFTDTLNGWTVGNSGTILSTVDGGDNWEEQISGISNNLLSVFFTNTTHGWVGGITDSWPNVGLMLRTTDGGNSWEELDIEVPPVQGIWFIDMLKGWAFGYGILHTTDGGETWEAQSVTGNAYTRCGYFIDSLNGWVSGGHGIGSTGYHYGYILHTIDGGNTWNYQFDYGGSDGFVIHSICFTDSLNGWSTGGRWGWNGIILKTTNGGNNWDTSYFDNSAEFNSICFIDSFNGWAVGHDGLIITTSDGGNTWETIPGGTTQYLNEVYFTKSGYGWIAGTEGTILHADYSQIVDMDEFDFQSLKSDIRCYPNPFTNSATIEYELLKPGTVVIKIFNQVGKLVEVTQMNDQKTENKFIWETNNLPSGIYFIQMHYGNKLIVKKILKL